MGGRIRGVGEGEARKWMSLVTGGMALPAIETGSRVMKATTWADRWQQYPQLWGCDSSPDPAGAAEFSS